MVDRETLMTAIATYLRWCDLKETPPRADELATMLGVTTAALDQWSRAVSGAPARRLLQDAAAD